MRIIIILFSFLLLSACQQQAETETEAQKAERQATLGETISTFNQAFLEVDRPMLDSMTTENYLHSNGSHSPISKEIWLFFLDQRKKQLADSSLQIETYRMDELEIQFHDDAAWVSGLVHTQGMRDSVMFDDEIRVSHLWVWENDSWKRAAFQDAKREVK